ncbi:hypothetical protein [Planobispora longispora]|uniref:Uncharacterized protein n=1 Tax=Planobispora longispora TaxID=28887 RepID=A0A8J3RRA0_9ACTN|nr:hypothetical protein [Planobispora longispora]GIH78204.1 hypothetical protein Plo01_46330 [Planobispora longispora]
MTTTDATDTAPCCSATTLQSCCEPADKGACCGTPADTSAQDAAPVPSSCGRR